MGHGLNVCVRVKYGSIVDGLNMDGSNISQVIPIKPDPTCFPTPPSPLPSCAFQICHYTTLEKYAESSKQQSGYPYKSYYPPSY